MQHGWPYETVAGMDALAALVFRDLDYAIAIEIGRGIAEVDGVWGAQGML